MSVPAAISLPALRLLSCAAFGLVMAGCVTAHDPALGAYPGNSASSDSSYYEKTPAGFGSLRQEEIALQISGSGIMVRMIPLDESVIRVLTPDSYKSMRDLTRNHSRAIEQTLRRYGTRHGSIWLVSFYGVEAESRFAPLDITITSGGREFRPFDFIPLTSGFSEQRVRQRETYSALYIFDGDIQLNQPITVAYQTSTNDSWEETLQQIERERAMILARASKSNQGL